jgi:hypothetical protein
MERPGFAAPARCIADIIIAGITSISLGANPPDERANRETQLNKKADIGVVRASYMKAHQEVTVMKLSIVAVAALLALSGPTLAQRLNGGGILGGSQPGTNAGVPYPNTTTDGPEPQATERPAAVERSDPKPQVAPAKHQKNSGKKSGTKVSAKKTVPPKDKVTPTNGPSPGASPPHG